MVEDDREDPRTMNRDSLSNALDRFTRRIDTIFGSDLTADGSHHGTGRLTSDEWEAYNDTTEAARKYLALLPDEDGQFNPELVERVSVAVYLAVGEDANMHWMVDPQYRFFWEAVLAAITEDT